MSLAACRKAARPRRVWSPGLLGGNAVVVSRRARALESVGLMLDWLKRHTRKLPPFARLLAERDRLRGELASYKTRFAPGHFYSPIPSKEEVRASVSAGAKALSGQICRVDLNTERQLALVSEFRQFVAELPFEAGPTTRTRYYYDNGYFSYIDP